MDSDKTDELKTTGEAASEALLEQAEALIWALLDDQIESPDIKRLEGWMQQYEYVRELYIRCVQMHVDLQGHFGESQPSHTTTKPFQSPVLGGLGDLRPGTDSWPPVSD